MKKSIYLIIALVSVIFFTGCLPSSQPAIISKKKNISVKVHDGLISYKNDFNSLKREVYTEFVPVYLNENGKREIRLKNLSLELKNTTKYGLNFIGYDIIDSNNNLDTDYEVIPYINNLYIGVFADYTYGLLVFKNKKIVANISSKKPYMPYNRFGRGDTSSEVEENFLYYKQSHWDESLLLRNMRTSLRYIYTLQESTIPNSVIKVLK